LAKKLDSHEDFLRSLSRALAFYQILDELVDQRGVIVDERTVRNFYRDRAIPKDPGKKGRRKRL
jgi:hypothetical protein